MLINEVVRELPKFKIEDLQRLNAALIAEILRRPQVSRSARIDAAAWEVTRRQQANKQANKQDLAFDPPLGTKIRRPIQIDRG